MAHFFLPVCLSSQSDEKPDPVPLGFGPESMESSHRQLEVGFENAGAVLSGTLYLYLPLSPGPHAAIVFHFGSDKWTRTPYGPGIQGWLDQDIAVLPYDKRGVGLSQGRCCPWKDADYFPLLAGDVAAAVRLRHTRPWIQLVSDYGDSVRVAG